MGIRSNTNETDYGAIGSADFVSVIDSATNQRGVTTVGEMLAGGSSTVEDSITAFAGGGQGDAYQLASQFNEVATVATIADSVKLPASVAGMSVFIVNNAANSMQVFGAGTDTINGVATATGVAQAGGKSAIYFCPEAGTWFRVLSA